MDITDKYLRLNEIKIGTRFKFQNKILEVRLDKYKDDEDSCKNCFFINKNSKKCCDYPSYFHGRRACEYQNREDNLDVIFKEVSMSKFTIKKLKEIIENLPNDYEVCIGTQGITLEVDDIVPMEEVKILKIECNPNDFVEYSKYVMLDN